MSQPIAAPGDQQIVAPPRALHSDRAEISGPLSSARRSAEAGPGRSAETGASRSPAAGTAQTAGARTTLRTSLAASGVGKPHRRWPWVALGVGAGLAGLVATGVIPPSIVGGAPAHVAAIQVPALSQPVNGITGQATSALQAGPASSAFGIIDLGGNAASTVSPPQAFAHAPVRLNPVYATLSLAARSDQVSTALPQSNVTHQQWSHDLGDMKTTVHDMNTHIDLLMRYPSKDKAAHMTAIDNDLTTLNSQLTAFNQKLGTDGPTLDKALGADRDTLNDVGTQAFGNMQTLDAEAGLTPMFSPLRHDIGTVRAPFYEATKDIAMATEKTTDSRLADQQLAQNMKLITQVVGQIQKAQQQAHTNASALSTVDSGSRSLENALGLTQKLVDQSTADLSSASTLSHQGATQLRAAANQLGQAQKQAATPTEP
jgi:hypothetical protein